MNAVRIVLSTIIPIALAAAVASARPPDGVPVDRVLETLELDDETRASVEAVLDESRADLEATHAEIGAARAALRELMEADAPDESQVMAMAAELGALEQDVMEVRLQTMLAVRALLSPEQRAALMELRGQRREAVEDACRDDAAALCADLADRHETGRCLANQRAALSDPCRDALASLRRGGSVGRR